MHQSPRLKRIPVSGPSITNKEIDYVKDAAENAWFENANIYNERFENTFSEYIGCRYAVSLPSCTSAIHLSLLALNIGPGDEVIVPDITWIASSAPVSYVGADTVFADIDPNTWCLSAETIKKKITSKTRAVIVVDLYGNMPDMTAIKTLLDRHDIALLEDAAEAFGSRINNHCAGTFGLTGVFSFHGSKTMTTGEGGMLITDDESIYKRVLFLRDHGRLPGDISFQNTEVAYKYKMSSLQAAFGLAQVERAEILIEMKRTIFSWYQKRLHQYSDITLNPEIEGGRNSFWMTTIIIPQESGMDKHCLIDKLSLYNIDSRPFFSPLSSLSAYKHTSNSSVAQKSNVISYRISNYGVNLPSGLTLTEQDVDYICNSLLTILEKYAA